MEAFLKAVKKYGPDGITAILRYAKYEHTHGIAHIERLIENEFIRVHLMNNKTRRIFFLTDKGEEYLKYLTAQNLLFKSTMPMRSRKAHNT